MCGTHDSEMLSNAGLEGVPMWKEGEALEQNRLGFESCHLLALWLQASVPSPLNLSSVTWGQ